MTAFTVETEMGPMHGEVDAQGALTRLAFGPGPGGDAPAALRTQLVEYFAGRRDSFDIALAPGGTPFQHEVWRALREIPYGTTMSYRELADRVGRPKASRAVGRANATNPIAIIVPCHRVIGSDGALTGYAYGVERKRELLAIEAGVTRLVGCAG